MCPSEIEPCCKGNFFAIKLNNNEENSYRDIGCDIMMINKEDDNDIIIVQCKNYESKNICVKDLSGFSFLFLISKVPIKGIIISHTECSQLVQSIFLNNDKIKYQKLEYNEHKEEKIIVKFEPRNYQIEASNKFNEKGILQLPCGMGKTYIACMIASNYDNIIILSPLRNYAVQLLEKFKATKIHSCFIVNEYGTLEGMITLNDILEAIVGDVPQSGQEEYEIITRQDGTYLVDAQIQFYNFLSHFEKTEWVNEDEYDFDTLAGFVLHELEHIPKTGETFDWRGFQFEIIDMDGQRIDKLLVKISEEIKDNMEE